MGTRSRYCLTEVSNRRPHGSQPSRAIDHIFHDQMHDAFLVLELAADLEQMRLQERIAVLLRDAWPDDEVDHTASWQINLRLNA